MTSPAAHEACFWAWAGMLSRDQGLAQAHESLDELLDAAHASSPVVQTVAMDIPTIRQLTRALPRPKTNEDQNP
jgi:hypothetical protein